MVHLSSSALAVHQGFQKPPGLSALSICQYLWPAGALPMRRLIFVVHCVCEAWYLDLSFDFGFVCL